MTKEIDAEWLLRLAHYAFVYVAGPKWNEKEAAARARQAHLDGVLAGQMASVVEEYPGLFRSISVKEETDK